jgi:Flp pilus assembly protein TadG
MMRRFMSAIRRLGAAPGGQDGVVSLEFAAIAPVLISMTIGAYDVGRAAIYWQETQTAAQNIAFAAATYAASPSGTDDNVGTDSSISPTAAQSIMSIIYGVIPEVKTTAYLTAGGQFSVTLSGVVFSTPTGGSPTAYVIWSAPLTELNSGAAGYEISRACGPLTPVNVLAENATTMTTLPYGPAVMASNSPIVIADVHVRYKPLFFWYITGPIDFWESYFQEPETGVNTGANPQEIVYDEQNLADSQNCPNQNPGS